MKPALVALGPLGRRLLLAFVLVAVFSVSILTGAALIGVDRGVQVVQQADRQQVATTAATAAADAYLSSGGWPQADLGRSIAIADAASARLFLFDGDGAALHTPSGSAIVGDSPHGQMKGGPSGSGAVSAPVTVDGVTVGTVRLNFGATAGSQAVSIAWTWIAVAAATALLVAVLASWLVTRRLVRPLHALTDAARAFAAGDRQSRVAVGAPGELGTLAVAFNGMAAAVVASERDRRNLTADVAHELRTPLAALQAGLEELRDGLADPTPEGLAGLHDQSLRLGRVVSDLAELSAAESVLTLRLAEVDLGEVARDELALRDPQLRTAELTVRAELGRVVVRADADRLHQLIGNLLANTVRYCRPGDSVTVSVTAENGQAVLVVSDTGPGIPADELPRVFDRLWRGRGASRVAGSGIGLAVVREIVTAHGGTIRADSAGRGTTITVRLPGRP
jgi:two-component system sensor histidine kinase BaeS